MSSVLLVDGENFKGRIKSVHRNAGMPMKAWHVYDFRKLFKSVLGEDGAQQIVFYFARIKEHPDCREKSKILIEEQRLLKNHLENSGFDVVLSGRVRGQWEQTKFLFPILKFFLARCELFFRPTTSGYYRLNQTAYETRSLASTHLRI